MRDLAASASLAALLACSGLGVCWSNAGAAHHCCARQLPSTSASPARRPSRGSPTRRRFCPRRQWRPNPSWARPGSTALSFVARSRLFRRSPRPDTADGRHAASPAPGGVLHWRLQQKWALTAARAPHSLTARNRQRRFNDQGRKARAGATPPTSPRPAPVVPRRDGPGSQSRQPRPGRRSGRQHGYAGAS
jgi:hypothetical protein